MLNRICSFFLVKDSERKQLGFSMLVFLLIGMGMAMGRGTADALFFKRYGIEFLPPMYILLGILLMAVSTLYAAMSDLVPAERFFKILINSLAVLLILNWILMSVTDANTAYPIYFLLYEVASELLLVHSALYLGQNFETLQAKRLYPLIFAGAQIGTILGGIFLATVAPKIGVQNVLIVWSSILILTLIILSSHHKRYGVSPYYRPTRKSRARIKQSIGQLEQALKFLKKSELLKSMSIAFFFMVITFYVLTFSINRVYTQSFSSEEELAAFFGVLAASTSILGLLLQLFVSGNAIRRFGIKNMNLLFPITTFICFVLLLFSPALPAAIIGSINKDALMPAFRSPVNNLFFNALPNYMQGRARAMSVALVLPLALVTTGILLMAAQQIEDTRSFLLLGLLTSFIYLFFNRKCNREYVSGVLSILKDKVFLPDPDKPLSIDANDKEIINNLIKGVQHEDDEISIAYSKILLSVNQAIATDVILTRLESAGLKMIDQLIKELVRFKSEEIDSALTNLIAKSDPHLRTTILLSMIKQGKQAAIPFIKDSLESSNPRLNVAGILGALTFTILNLEDKAYSRWAELLGNENNGAVIAGLTILKLRPDIRFSNRLINCLRINDIRVIKSALNTLASWPYEKPKGLIEALNILKQHADPEIREKVIKCTSLLPRDQRLSFLYLGLEDEHPRVRNASAKSLLSIDQSHINQAIDSVIKSSVSPKAQEALLSALLGTHMDTNQLNEIAQAKAHEAHKIAIVIYSLNEIAKRNKTSNSLQLLQMVLSERKNLVVNLFLTVLERIEESEAIEVIRSGFNSNDPRNIANAAEVLRNMPGSKFSHIMVEILDEVGFSQKSNKNEGKLFHTINDVIFWCKKRTDPWLVQCAEYAEEQLAISENQYA